MTVTFYASFSKRRNSTKLPSGSSQGFGSVRLKEGTSMMKPVFLLSMVNWNWNYASWNNRYYYVIDIVSQGNEYFEIHCELDVLATFKSQIGNYSTLISRAASDQNYDVVESIYPALARPNTKRVSITNPGIFSTNRANGCYIVGALGTGGIHFYVMSPTTFAAFCTVLIPAYTVGTIDDWAFSQIGQAFVGGLGTILQNIVLIKWLPVSYTTLSSICTFNSNVYVGNFKIDRTAHVSFSGAYELTSGTTLQLLGVGIQFPDRDDAGARGRWLYQAPFANYSVYIPPFGMLQVDGTYMAGAGRTLEADIMIEAISGNVTLRLYYSLGSSGPKMVGVYNSNISQDMKIGGSSANVGGVLGGIGGALMSYAEEKWAGVVGGIASAAGAAIPHTSTAGGSVNGPSPDLDANWYAYATYFDPIDENQAELGRPLAEVKTISTLSGFVQCADAKLAIPGHAEEMVEVNNLLNSGIFYE